MQGSWIAIIWLNLVFQSMCCKRSNPTTSTISRTKMAGSCIRCWVVSRMCMPAVDLGSPSPAMCCFTELHTGQAVLLSAGSPSLLSRCVQTKSDTNVCGVCTVCITDQNIVLDGQGMHFISGDACQPQDSVSAQVFKHLCCCKEFYTSVLYRLCATGLSAGSRVSACFVLLLHLCFGLGSYLLKPALGGNMNLSL